MPCAIHFQNEVITWLFSNSIACPFASQELNGIQWSLRKTFLNIYRFQFCLSLLASYIRLSFSYICSPICFFPVTSQSQNCSIYAILHDILEVNEKQKGWLSQSENCILFSQIAGSCPFHGGQDQLQSSFFGFEFIKPCSPPFQPSFQGLKQWGAYHIQ